MREMFYQIEMVTLRGGIKVAIRPIRPSDAPHLQALIRRLSPESVFHRFLGQCKELPAAEAKQLAVVDYDSRMGLVATTVQDREEVVIALANYAVIRPDEPGIAEVSIVVEDYYQSRGLGTILLQRLVAYAREHDIHTFQATIHSNNNRIMSFIRRSGLPFEGQVSQGVWEIRVKLK